MIIKIFVSDYGVIAGKIDINTGFGLPNVKVSIFVPIDAADADNPVIQAFILILMRIQPKPMKRNKI